MSDNHSYIGEIAVKTIERECFAGKMFFSSKGVTASAGILESNEFECATKAAMLKNSQEVYYLCDSSKIGKVGFLKLAEFDRIDCFITVLSWMRRLLMRLRMQTQKLKLYRLV